MLTLTFYRWSAWALILGAAILSIGYLLRTNIEKELIDNFATTQGYVSTTMVATGALLLLCGLPGFFARQARYLGKSGLLASGLSFMGMEAFHLGTLALYFVLPVLVHHNAATRALVYSDVPPFTQFALFWALSLLIQTTGLIWLGIKTWKAGLYPRPVALLLIAGSIIFLLAPTISFHLIKTANTLIMAGLVWGGGEMLRGKSVEYPSKKIEKPVSV